MKMIKSVKLIPREMQFPEARFLTRAEQERYGELCKPFGEKAQASLKVGINGSNLWKVILLNQNGIRTATLPELDLIAESNPEFLSGTYEDVPSIVLRSAGDSYAPNNYLAKGLADLIKRTSFPHVVVIEGLKISEDENSHYGLSFIEREGFRVINAPAFDHINHERKFKRINPDYTIDFDDNAQRTLYTRDKGVSGLSLSWALDADSGGEALAGSDGGGRVVIVSGEAAGAKNFQEYSTKLQEEANRQKAEIDARFVKAQAVLLGK